MSNNESFRNNSKKKAKSLKDTWFIPVMDKITEYVKRNYYQWFVDFQEKTHNRVFCGFTVREKSGKTYSIVIVGKKLHPKFDIYNEPK